MDQSRKTTKLFVYFLLTALICVMPFFLTGCNNKTKLQNGIYKKVLTVALINGELITTHYEDPAHELFSYLRIEGKTFFTAYTFTKDAQKNLVLQTLDKKDTNDLTSVQKKELHKPLLHDADKKLYRHYDNAYKDTYTEYRKVHTLPEFMQENLIPYFGFWLENSTTEPLKRFTLTVTQLIFTSQGSPLPNETYTLKSYDSTTKIYTYEKPDSPSIRIQTHYSNLYVWLTAGNETVTTFLPT